MGPGRINLLLVCPTHGVFAALVFLFYQSCVPLAAAHARELEEDKRRLTVSLSAREEDLLVADRQMQALSTRLKAEARASGETAARAEAVAGELRKALEDAAAGGTTAAAGEGEEDSDRPSAWDRVAWAEERARLHHNLLSLREALRDGEAQAEADKAALSSRLEAAQDEGERSARERASLREALDSLRVELAEALLAAAATAPRRHDDGSVSVGGGGGGDGDAGGAHAPPAVETSDSIAAREEEEEEPHADEEAGGGGGDDGEVVRAGGGRREEGAEESVGDRGTDTKEGCVREPENGGQPAEVAGSAHRRIGSSGDGAVATGARDRWLDGGFEGSVGELVLASFGLI